MIRIFIIEDHETYIVSGIKRLFSSPSRDSITVAGSSKTVEEVIAQVSNDSFDILILDLWLQNRMPLQNYRLLKKIFPEKPIIILTSDETFRWQQKMFKEGAHGYIRKTSGKKDLKTATEMAMRNERFFPSDLKQFNKNKEQLSNKKQGKLLTQEIEEIVSLLSQGYSHKTIANHLGVSEAKIDKVLKTLREKFDVSNSLELVFRIKKIHETD
jgi:DNA-binding NarL/FixJ family response regulator